MRIGDLIPHSMRLLVEFNGLVVCNCDTWPAVYAMTHGRRLFKISGSALVCITSSPGRQSQWIQNVADNRVSTKNTGLNGVELQGVHLPLLLLNSKSLLSQNKTDHIRLNQLHYLLRIWRWEVLWTTINFQQIFFLGPNEYLLMLI
jgi:hypothetical protein